MVAPATDKEYMENFGTDIVHNLKKFNDIHSKYRNEENHNHTINGEYYLF